MYHVFFTHASIGRHLTHFHVLAIVNTAEITIGVDVSFELQFFPDIYLEGGLLDHHFSSVVESYPTLCNPMDRNTRGFPVHHQLLEIAQMHVHRISNNIELSRFLLSPSHPALNLSQLEDLFQ